MLTIQNIDHVVFRVTNLEKMIAFYTDVLGARFERLTAAIGLYQLRVGTCLIDLVPVDGKLGKQAGPGPCGAARTVDHVSFRVLPWRTADILALLHAHAIHAKVASPYA